MLIQHLDPIFATLAPGVGGVPRAAWREKLNGTCQQGNLHCGQAGAGHFVKMAHNGIEYGLMAAYAEGLSILRAAKVGKPIEVIERGETDRLWQMIFELKAGTHMSGPRSYVNDSKRASPTFIKRKETVFYAGFGRFDLKELRPRNFCRRPP